MIQVSLSATSDLDSVGSRWRAMERNADCSFFQSWAWIGCLGQERYPDPVLLEAYDDDRPIAMALFNRRPAPLAAESLWLAESGLAEQDGVFVEHNGPLIVRDAPAGTLAACLAAAMTQPIAPRRRPHGRRVILSGVATSLLAALPPVTVRRRAHPRPSPLVDLAGIPPDRNFLDGLSANTRQQIRRSDRRYAALGPLHVTAAATTPEALEWLDRLGALHQARWEARGRPGAFAGPYFRRFHTALIARAEGSAELLRIAAGEAVIGYLYNFLWHGQALSYQSGFDYAAADHHQKPGLTCHHLAIEHYRRAGFSQYDLLAGGDRYKTSLAGDAPILHWLELLPRRSPRAWAQAIRDRFSEHTAEP